MTEPRPSQTAPSGAAAYAGDLSPKQAWERLAQEPTSQLIDVRSEAEWNFVGVPNFGAGGRQAILCEWSRFPAAPNPNFVRDVEAALKGTNDSHLEKRWKFVWGGKVVNEGPRHQQIADVFTHMAHHRGQLTVYLRLNEAKVPAIYGPSADERLG